jgi:hypothetical protein
MPTNTALPPQGDLRLLESAIAQRLLAAAIPARFAYVALDGTPRVVPTWFHWTGDELVMPTFISAPHVHAPARRIRALRSHPDVAVTIDTEGFPPNVLLLRGRVTVTELDGVDPDYAAAAHRYLGEEGAVGYLGFVGQPGTRMARIALRPSWAGVLDFDTRSPGGMV